MKNKNRLSTIPEIAERTFEQHIRSLVSIAKAGGSRVIISTFTSLYNPNLDYTKPETIHSLSEFQRHNLLSLLHFTPGLTLEGIFNGFNRYNEILRKIAAEEKCLLVDNAVEIPFEDRYFLDRVHFSEAGAEIMANNIYPGVVKVLAGAQLLQ